jgi:hypothetical protein
MKIKKAARSAPRMAVAMAMPATFPSGRQLEQLALDVVARDEVVRLGRTVMVIVEVILEVLEEFLTRWKAMILCRTRAPNGLTEAFEATYRSCNGVLRQHIKSFWKC